MKVIKSFAGGYCCCIRVLNCQTKNVLRNQIFGIHVYTYTNTDCFISAAHAHARYACSKF